MRNNFRKRRQGVVLALEKRPVKGGKLRSYVKVLWNTSSVPCYHASHALLLLKEREDAIEETKAELANIYQAQKAMDYVIEEDN